MANRKITELNALTGANATDTDVFAIVDVSADETKKMTLGEFKNALDTGSGFVRITGDTMTGDLGLSGADITFGDNDKAIFGARSDLSIYHDPANGSIVKDSGDGRLLLDSENGTGISLTSGGIAKTMVSATKDGDVKLYHNGSQKLATTSTGIDVTGTVTADGLTVDGAAAIGANATKVNFYSDSTYSGIYNGSSLASDEAIYMGGDAMFFYAAGKQRLNINAGGDISFYEDTGTTPKFFWDASAESLGIGTSSPSEKLVLANGSNEIKIGQDGSSHDIFSNGKTFNIGTTDGTVLRMFENNSEVMRLSGGNLLVRTTNTDPIGSLDSGMRIGDGFFNINNSVASGFFGRSGSDGNILQFYKDGSMVGSIGVQSTDQLYIGTPDGNGVGIVFDGDNRKIDPTNGSGSNLDAAVDLGNGSHRFKDLYLSGGVYLGGTGAANKLDDYESGSWTPTISSGTFTAENAWYVKVGTLITISAKLSGFSDTSSGSTVTLGGVPFTTKASDHTAQGSMIADYLSNGPYFPYISNNATTIRFYIQSATNYTTMLHSNLGSSGSFYFTLTYQTQ